MNPIIVIPARMASTRLKDKPMADIAGKPMIVHVWERAVASKIGDVVVACDCDAIVDAITAVGGKAVLTEADLPSGSDRIWQALKTADPNGTHDVVINVQGDMPTLEPEIIAKAAALLETRDVDIGTLAAPISDTSERNNPAVVKPAIAFKGAGETGRALYFSRHAIPYSGKILYHHIGIYAYRRSALEQFVAYPPSLLEMSEKLEQLRALEMGMRIDIAVVDAVPLGVDTPETLEKARGWHERYSQ